MNESITTCVCGGVESGETCEMCGFQCHDTADKLESLPAFSQWVPNVLRHKRRVASKVKSRHWKTAHIHGVRLPRSVEEASELDHQGCAWIVMPQIEVLDEQSCCWLEAIVAPQISCHFNSIADVWSFGQVRIFWMSRRTESL